MNGFNGEYTVPDVNAIGCIFDSRFLLRFSSLIASRSMGEHAPFFLVLLLALLADFLCLDEASSCCCCCPCPRRGGSGFSAQRSCSLFVYLSLVSLFSSPLRVWRVSCSLVVLPRRCGGCITHMHIHMYLHTRRFILI